MNSYLFCGVSNERFEGRDLLTEGGKRNREFADKVMGFIYNVGKG